MPDAGYDPPHGVTDLSLSLLQMSSGMAMDLEARKARGPVEGDDLSHRKLVAGGQVS